METNFKQTAKDIEFFFILFFYRHLFSFIQKKVANKGDRNSYLGQSLYGKEGFGRSNLAQFCGNISHFLVHRFRVCDKVQLLK